MLQAIGTFADIVVIIFTIEFGFFIVRRAHRDWVIGDKVKQVKDACKEDIESANVPFQYLDGYRDAMDKIHSIVDEES